MDTLETALQYLELGLHPIPLVERGKRPLGPWSEYQSRPPHRSEVEGWFTKHPDANLGLVMGCTPGLIAIDCDSSKGEEFLESLIGQPVTPVNLTPKGRHVLFRHPGGRVLTRSRILPDVDVRGDGGYIAAPPSVHETGVLYKWDTSHGRGIDVLPADVPLALLDVLSESSNQLPRDGVTRDGAAHEDASEDPLTIAGAPIPEGMRNQTLARIAGRMLAAGHDSEQVFEHCLRINHARCVPRLPRDEVRRVVDSISKREASKKGIAATPIRRGVQGLLLNTRRLDTVVAEATQWLWRGYIPLGSITVLDGPPGVGKSTFTLELAAMVSTGRSMPDGSTGIEGHVLLLSYEDSVSRTVIPRLNAMEADTSRISVVDTVQLSDGTSRLPHFPEDLPFLEDVVKQHATRLIIVDPFSAFLSASVNSWSDQHVRVALAPLARLAEQEQLAVLVIRHPTKNREAAPMEAGSGSMAIIAASRSAFYMARNPEDESQVIIAPLKQNLAVPVPSLALRVVDGGNGAPKIEWIGRSQLDAQALRPLSREGVDKLGAAEALLREVLADGPRPVKEVEEEANRRGVSQSTLKRARSTLKVIATKQGFSESGNWTLALPTPANPISDVSSLTQAGEELPIEEETESKKLNLLNRDLPKYEASEPKTFTLPAPDGAADDEDDRDDYAESFLSD